MTSKVVPTSISYKAKVSKKYEIMFIIIILIILAGIGVIIWYFVKKASIPPPILPPDGLPNTYKLSYPSQNTDDPLGIGKKITKTSNGIKGYCIVLGDWGAGQDHSTSSVNPDRIFCIQKAVAQMMKEYVHGRDEPLLFVIANGDNFYMNGLVSENNNVASTEQKPGLGFKEQWSDIYGPSSTAPTDLTSVPWLVALGNHDWGYDADENPCDGEENCNKYNLCPWKNPNRKAYNGFYQSMNQLNVEKGGYRPQNIPNSKNFYLPDYCYHYYIPELDFELISVDQNKTDCPAGIGWNLNSTNLCKSPALNNQDGCGFLDIIQKAGEDLIIDRAQKTKASNVILTQHYDEQVPVNLLELFSKNSPRMDSTDIRMSYGHRHTVVCEDNQFRTSSIGTTPKNQCQFILSGGGGGCCGGFNCSESGDCQEMNRVFGFAVIEFLDDGNGGTTMNNLPIVPLPKSPETLPDVYTPANVPFQQFGCSMGYTSPSGPVVVCSKQISPYGCK